MAWHRTPLLACVLVGAACAHDPYAPETQTWGEAKGTQPKQDLDDVKRGAQPGDKLMTAQEYAARFKSSAECELEARRLLGQDDKQGKALFRACLAREDFVLLEPFYTDPWRELLTDSEGRLELARVIANRGGSVGADLRELARERVAVPTLTQMFEQGARARGKVLIARLRYIGPRKEVKGELVFEETTLTPEEDLDTEAAQEALDAIAVGAPASVLTGQRAVLELPEDQQPREGDELVVVAEFLGIEKAYNEELNEEQDVALLRVLESHRPKDRGAG